MPHDAGHDHYIRSSLRRFDFGDALLRNDLRVTLRTVGPNGLGFLTGLRCSLLLDELPLIVCSAPLKLDH